MPFIRARLRNVFEMWITCSEKEAKWKLNNPDLSELGKIKTIPKKKRELCITGPESFHPFQLHIQWTEYGLIKKIVRKVGKLFFVQNILRRL